MASDSCPYRKPFPPEFHECTAFTPQTYVAFDLHYQPTVPVSSCTHLAVGEPAGQVGAFYPRCRLGDAADREAWVRQVSAERLAALRELSAEYRQWSRSQMAPLWELKGRMLAARHRGDSTEARHAAQELESALQALMRSAEAFVDARRAQCEALGLPPAPLKDLIRLATEDWAWSSALTTGYQVPDELLARFPEPIRLFFTSSRTADTPR